MKKYSIGLFVLFLGCVALIGAAYQFSFQYSKRQAEEEARLKQEIMKSVKEEEEDAVAAEGDVSKGEVIRQEIQEGKEIRTVEKLYGFLENYSS